ncbi:MAG: hypothetical protein HC810_01595 [Acaryochloridaceae cyanobacterium RL_2_7]|nr:hypothetical protein [Acaryochloridaceae cyanobacterium RL_2_7]
MARTGVSEKQIRAAIVQLERNGTAINVTQIREILGTGSFSTISRVLQKVEGRGGDR